MAWVDGGLLCKSGFVQFAMRNAQFAMNDGLRPYPNSIQMPVRLPPVQGELDLRSKD